MNNISEAINDGIKSGIYNAWDLNFKFHSNDEYFFNAEYILTVKIAESIADNLREIAINHEVELESKTNKVTIKNVGFKNRRNRSKPARNGKVDIAIYVNDYLFSVIEVKAFNCVNHVYEKDVIRCAQILIGGLNDGAYSCKEAYVIHCFSGEDNIIPINNLDDRIIQSAEQIALIERDLPDEDGYSRYAKILKLKLF